MTSSLQLQVCPETGICSILRTNTDKVDLMPDEVESIRTADGDHEQIQAVIAESDRVFASALTPDDLTHIAHRLA